MRQFFLKIILHRITGLFRTRVILSMVGLYAMYKEPSIGPWVTGIVGLALGVSAVDAWKSGVNDGQDKGDPQ